MNPVEKFRDAMHRAGLDCDKPIEADGNIRRFRAVGDHGRDSWCVLYAGPPAAGAFGSWRHPDIWKTWCDRDAKHLTPSEHKEVRRKIEEVKQAHEREKGLRQKKARKLAVWILSKWKPADSDHPYLVRKAVQPHGDIHQNARALAIPLRDVDDVVHSLQFIYADGEKRFLTGGRVEGCCFTIADAGNGPMILCEGLATGLSIFEATGHAVYCAMHCGNLLAVARALRSKWPERDIIIGADNDKFTEGNPGVTKATEAAKAIRARLALPRFKTPKTKGTDFNDLHQLEGANAVKEQIQSAQKPGDVEWPEPKPLLNDLPEVPAFDYACLPDTLRPWIEDIADRMQCPPDFPAVGAMIALGSLVGRKTGIRPKGRDEWLVIPNLWGCVVGRPGLMKTPALEQPLVPLRRLVAEAMDRYQAKIKQHNVNAMLKSRRTKLAEKEIENSLKAGNEQAARTKAEAILKQESDEPVCRRYEINDSTIEKLGELLAENPTGLLLFRDELVGFFRGLDREGREGDRQKYLEMWDGKGCFTYDRIGRGTVRVESNTLSILGGIQPDLLMAYVREAVRGGLGADGLLQRFQVAVWPDVSKDWSNVDRWPDKEAKNEAFAVFKYLDELTAEAAGADTSDGIPFLRFADDAQGRFDLWRAELEKSLRSDTEHPAFEAHLSKYRKLIPALALLIHLANRGTGPVSLAALEKSLLWAGYLEAHARRIYSAVLRPDATAARELAKHLRRGELIGKFTLRETYRKGWAGLGTKEDAEAATEILCDLGWIRPIAESGRTTGRPASPLFEINPKIRQTTQGEMTELTKVGSGGSVSDHRGVLQDFQTASEKTGKTPSPSLTEPTKAASGSSGSQDEGAVQNSPGSCSSDTSIEPEEKSTEGLVEIEY
jgi:putative DNA primase/helicase